METNNLDINLSPDLRSAIEKQAERYALSVDDVARLAIEAGIKRIGKRAARLSVDLQHKAEIERLIHNHTLEDIGKMRGITRQRVHQICTTLGVQNPRRHLRRAEALPQSQP